MKRIVRLTESDLTRIVRRVIMEQAQKMTPPEVPIGSSKEFTLNGIQCGLDLDRSQPAQFVQLIDQKDQPMTVTYTAKSYSGSSDAAVGITVNMKVGGTSIGKFGEFRCSNRAGGVISNQQGGGTNLTTVPSQLKTMKFNGVIPPPLAKAPGNAKMLSLAFNSLDDQSTYHNAKILVAIQNSMCPKYEVV